VGGGAGEGILLVGRSETMALSVTNGCVVPLCTDQCAVARRLVDLSVCKWYFMVTGQYEP